MAKGERIGADETPTASTGEMLDGLFAVVAAMLELLEEADPSAGHKLSARLLELCDAHSDTPGVSQSISYYERILRRPGFSEGGDAL